ncbi:hypothetical protein [Chryseobacterium aureum]|uniref:hypothetical protein n=1 Tax=Chryseobacterium aureum TaxID=2497456 RepID=UPI000F87A05D|nr:hypothetical protein [Chryseobacterium aureum]
MKTLFLGITFFSISISAQIGIGLPLPSNMLHVRGNVTQNPLRIEGLQSNSSNLDNLAVSTTGLIKRQNLTTVSAVRISGTLNMPANNTYYTTNATTAPTEEFDNLNEFSGSTFTASRPGLYLTTFTLIFPQRSSALDGGDGYQGSIYIDDSGGNGESSSTKIFNPESTLAAADQYMTAKYLTKMNLGQQLYFGVVAYGSSGNVNGITYKINIVRMD